MKMNIIVGVVVGMLLMLLVGCSGTNIAQTQQWQANAKENAINYVRDKYGFTSPKVVSVRSAKGSSDFLSLPDNTATTYVTMKANGREFVVETNGSSSDYSQTRDNYQQEEICNAISEVITELSAYDVKHVDVLYWTPHFSVKYMAHDLYEVAPNASAMDKALALQTVFNKQYSHNQGEAERGYSQVFIHIYLLGDDIDGIARETEYLEKDVFKIELINLFEIACDNEADIRRLVEISNNGPTLNENLAIYMNGYAEFAKQAGYTGVLNVNKYVHCNILGRECVISGCSEAEASVTVVDGEANFTDDFGASKPRISELYHISLPEGAKLVMYFPENEFAGYKTIGIGRRINVNMVNGTVRVRYNLTKKLENSYVDGYYCTGGKNDEEFCFVSY